MVEVKDLVLEERVHLLEGVRTFASFVTNKYPQTNEEDELNYYISGSLAVMLLSQAHSMDLLNPLQIPKISSRESRLLPINFTERLCSFTRKIGDFDYVQTIAYENAKVKIPDYSDDPEGYRKGRRQFLWKGGGGPSIDELPELARGVLKDAKPGCKVMCDPISTYGEDKIVRVELGDGKYFISDPSQIFGYKVLHLMQSFHNKSDGLKRDFTILYDALLQLVPEKELIVSAYDVLVEFEDAMQEYGPQATGQVQKLYQNPDFNSDVKSFFDKLKQHDLNHWKIM